MTKEKVWDGGRQGRVARSQEERGGESHRDVMSADSEGPRAFVAL